MYREQIGNLGSINTIYLQLGPQCNMQCKHCIQTPITPEKHIPFDSSVIDFIKSWSIAMQAPTALRKQGELFFWGGEPLLFWDEIKELVETFASEGIKNIRYRIYTNGLLLNPDISNFCNTHNIFVILSYDTPDSLAVRSHVPSTAAIAAFLKCKNRRVNSVLTPQNSSLVDIFTTTESLFPNTEVVSGIITPTWEMPRELYTFKPGVLTESVHSLADQLQVHDPLGNRLLWFKKRVQRMLEFDERVWLQLPFPPCKPGLASLTINRSGDIIRCHNDNLKLANVEDPLSDIQLQHIKQWRKNFNMCVSCPVVDMCRGLCPISVTNDAGEYLYCDYIREFFSAIKDSYTLSRVLPLLS